LQIPLLIHELIATEIWKEKVFPEIVDLNVEQDLLFPIYSVVSDCVCNIVLITSQGLRFMCVVNVTKLIMIWPSLNLPALLVCKRITPNQL
jgi:hypothetical protein